MDLKATVYISWGQWVANCPADGCPGAEHFGHAPITGFVGGLTQTGFQCAHCGLRCPAVWPPAEVCADVVRLLAMRPVPATRSWLVDEDPENLLMENVAHGLLSEAELLAVEHTPGDAIPIMTGGRMAPHIREIVTAHARRVLAAEADRGAALNAQSLLAVGS